MRKRRGYVSGDARRNKQTETNKEEGRTDLFPFGKSVGPASFFGRCLCRCWRNGVRDKNGPVMFGTNNRKMPPSFRYAIVRVQENFLFPCPSLLGSLCVFLRGIFCFFFWYSLGDRRARACDPIAFSFSFFCALCGPWPAVSRKRAGRICHLLSFPLGHNISKPEPGENPQKRPTTFFFLFLA